MRGEAIDALKKAIAAGFKDADALKKNADFDSIRERKEFKELVASTEKVAAGDRVAQPATRNKAKLAARPSQADAEQRLLELGAASLDHQATLAGSLHAIGLIQLGLKQFGEAEKSLCEALAISQSQHKQKPRDAAIGTITWWPGWPSENSTCTRSGCPKGTGSSKRRFARPTNSRQNTPAIRRSSSNSPVWSTRSAINTRGWGFGIWLPGTAGTI